MMVKHRIQWLDFARGFAILFVVMAHSFSSLTSTFPTVDKTYFTVITTIVYTVIMPCFFAISGYLYKSPRNVHEYVILVYKKGISLIIPYIIFSVIYVIIQHLDPNKVNNPYPYSRLFTLYSSPISYMWFLYSLLLIFLIIGLLDLLHINHSIQLIIYIILMAISILFPHLLWQGVTQTFNSILYFYIGYLIANNKVNNIKIINDLKSKNTSWLLTVLLIIFFIVESLFVIGAGNNNSLFSNLPTKLVSIFLLFQVSSIIPHKHVFHYFDKYGKITLIIYLVHAPIIPILRIIFNKFIPVNSFTLFLISILLTITTWYLSIFMCYLSKKFTIINFIFYPRKSYISKWLKQTNIGKRFFDKQS